MQACLNLGTGEFCYPEDKNLGDMVRRFVKDPTALELKAPGGSLFGWIKESGVDLIGCKSDFGAAQFKFFGEPPSYRSGDKVTFDTVQPSEVIELMNSPSFYSNDNPKLPSIHVQTMKLDEKSASNANFIRFRTHDGDAGVMEIIGASQNPRGVKIRYKLVQKTPADSPSKAAVSTPAFSGQGTELSPLRCVVEEKPPIAPAMDKPIVSPLFPLKGEAVGYADFDGQFHPIMYLAEPHPRGASENLALAYVGANGPKATFKIYRGTNPLATANHFLGSYEITRTPADTGLEIGFELNPQGQLVLKFIATGDPGQSVALQGKVVRRPDAPDAPVGKIRYMKSGDTLAPSTAAQRSFGPVVERVVQLGDNDGPTQWLNLDTGALIEKPGGWWLQAAGEKAWNALPGLGFAKTDLSFDATAIGMVFLSTLANEKWDTSTPELVAEDVERIISEGKVKSRFSLSDTTVLASDNGKWPKTYIFKTPKRTLGLLQITGLTENPRGVKLRYKLVQRVTSEPQASEQADLRAARAKLLELRVDYAENHPVVQKALARVHELERLAKYDPNAPAELREAKARLAELRIDYAEQHPEIQKVIARIMALESK